ncbi:uncharacterized protein FA14DRAFT_191221 [Meira miltonrushii]|uniref:Stealth protein CR2 conserved region 2 domain-containing protein n=1 Tax=Meira miltonrushii TaxID=1280837 RepID=A0A316VAM8_9BASI|nr:uncharacterized protein FA14DRAFT_191221 [Meira miltonrushii]PWN34138.1 hypothetical protein FA14DRAFT_191221 [Meira miltonrushii]
MPPIMLGGKNGSRLSPILIFCLFCFGFLFFVRPHLNGIVNGARDHSRQWVSTNQSIAKPSSASQPPLSFDWASDVSVVYTWVNGSVPEQARLRKQYGGPSISGRFRDNEDLRFSMRTWINNAPWHTGKIYIVSPTPPDWLDLTHPRVEWVDQNTIIPTKYQPAFTSNIIEQYLYRIPGLTERFIHLNDDYMIDRKISPSDLFTAEGGARFFYSRTNVNDDPRPRTGIWFRSLLNTVDAIERAYGTDKGQTRFLKHAPYVYYKSAMEGVHRRFKDVLEVTNHHKFRHEQDVLLPYLHHAYVINEGSRCCSLKYDVVNWKKTAKDSTLLIWTEDVENNVYSIENIGKPLFLTINDSMGRGNPVAAELQIRQFYQSRYGHLRSPYEKEHLRI